MFYIEDNIGKILNVDNANLNVDNFQKIFIRFNNKQYGFNRKGNFFIDNFTFDLKHNVINYEMKLLKGKTIRHDVMSTENYIFGYYLGYELISSNEYYKYVMRVNNNKVYIEANREINGKRDFKIIEL